MPYQTNDELPASVRSHLPQHAQDIYREAFNHAFAAHAGDDRQEEAAHRIAWAAVKRSPSRSGIHRKGANETALLRLIQINASRPCLRQ